MDIKARDKYFKNAVKLQKKANYNEAVEELKKVLQLDPNFVEGHYLLGNIYHLTEKLEDAVSCYKNILKIDPHNSKAKYMIDLLIDDGKADADTIQERKSEEDAKAYFDKGVGHYKSSNFDDAIKSFEKAIKIYPMYHQAYYNLGVIYYKNGNKMKAVEFWNKVIEFDPKNPKAFLNLGISAYRDGDFVQAMSCWEKAASTNAPIPQIYGNLGVVYEHQGNKSKAMEYLKKAVDINPDYELMKKNIEQLS